MNAYKWTYLGLMFIELLVQVRKHGTPRDDYNIWIYFINLLIFFGLMIPGGFFS